MQIYFIENERILLNYLIIEKTRIEQEEDLKYKNVDKIKSVKIKNKTLFDCIYIYRVVISVCLFVCLSVHNSETPRPICFKILLVNSGESRECS